MASGATPSEVSDDELIRQFRVITLAFVGGLLIVLALGVTVLIPGRTLRTTGAAIGAVLGLWSWIGSRWITTRGTSSATRSRAPRAQERNAGDDERTGGAGAARTIAFLGLGMAEAPALVGLPLSLNLGGDVGPLVIAVPVAVAAIILNASGPGAMRRHLQRVRSGRTD